MKILRYTDKIRQQLGSKPKAEPWMHIALSGNGDHTAYAIYAWDTRIPFDSGYAEVDAKKITGTSAQDNKQPLKGSGEVIELINRLFNGRPKKPKANGSGMRRVVDKTTGEVKYVPINR